MQIATSTGEERAAATNAVLRLRAVRSRDPAASEPSYCRPEPSLRKRRIDDRIRCRSARNGQE